MYLLTYLHKSKAVRITRSVNSRLVESISGILHIISIIRLMFLISNIATAVTSASNWLMDSFCWSLFRWLSSRWRWSCETSSCHWLRSSTRRHCRSTTCRCSCDSSRAFFSSYQTTHSWFISFSAVQKTKTLRKICRTYHRVRLSIPSAVWHSNCINTVCF